MARGCVTFDFGRTDPDDTGLREFKSRWGTEEGVLTYSVLSDTPNRTGERSYSPPWSCCARASQRPVRPSAEIPPSYA